VANILKSLCVAAVLLLGASPCLPAAVVVSSKLSSESAMIGQMIRLLLNADGIQTLDRMTLGATPVVRKALLSGEIDLYVEYTGNAGFFFNIASDPAWKDLLQGYQLGSRLDYQANHIVWLTPANASNSWALAVRRDVAAANHLRTMSDFGRWVAGGGQVVLACSAEFANAGTLRSLGQRLRNALPTASSCKGIFWKPRWLLWLEGPSTDESRRAAAALRPTTAMLTNTIYGALAPLHLYVATPNVCTRKNLDYCNSRTSGRSLCGGL
jgi:osmoprotectant transport system substrate-binding protein